MEPHPLFTHVRKFVQEHGVPQILDVDHSIQAHKPSLSGSTSPASYYLRAPDGMTADALVEWFEALPEYRDFKLTLVAILGLDTFHQPLISTDDFAHKYFHDNHLRIIRVVGKSNQAIEAMTAFVEALKRPFDSSVFPHHSDFLVSGYRPGEPERATEVKLLYKPADHTLLVKVERLVSIHLDECNLGREIGATRHATRDQAPELMLTSVTSTPAAMEFLDALVNSLPRATDAEIAAAIHEAKKSHVHAVAAPAEHTKFVPVQAPNRALAPEQLKKQAITSLAEVMRASRFANGAEVAIVFGGTTIEVGFPRTASTLWLGSSFSEAKHIREVANAYMSLRTDPVFREGWTAIYHFDKSAGKLHIRAADAGAEPHGGWKAVPG
jgi:hypothetical protein